ncbi:Sugar transferase involved in LPS biosynthesis (colanic, teichoic acid) [Thalassovita taeanensis]|uniref:Sugar transferase involved in LPS biosynthesis (Colanic, teichoic acid) n=2 Tax=Thalassovita taeanensis TaxID=657014 RepID=A0A1H9IA06_9RHOB|nr:Sugar transferase involved in LPS biosynthesis (colanic, teichoic acid) [Thalassovita taeanensis]
MGCRNMTPMKRFLDVLAALILTTVLFPLILWLIALILIREGRPILYISERMKTVDRPFGLWKFRTMRTSSTDSGVSGGDKASRITPTGEFMRKYRLDEIPQLWNILRGDISFVGPRPPLRRYVEMFPELYGEVLKARPGITGLATIAFHQHEENLLAACKTPKETERVYVERCVARKARIDLIYQKRHHLCLDFLLMLKTVYRRLPLQRHRPPRG